MIRLCDIVLATEEQVEDTYKVKDARRFYAPLLEHKFLPVLTAETLRTQEGRQLMHLAAWTYLSGNIRKNSFTLSLSLDDRTFAEVKENYFHGDMLNFTPHAEGQFVLNGNCFGRLLYAMGVPTSDGDGEERDKKADYRISLPRFFKRLLHDNDGQLYKMTPDEHRRRRDLMKEIVRVIVKDRLNVMENRKNGYKTYMIDLRTHSTKEQAVKYGMEVAEFINQAYNGPNSSLPQIEEDQIRIHQRKDGNKVHLCWITLKPEQVGYFASTGGGFFDLKVKY